MEKGIKLKNKLKDYQKRLFKHSQNSYTFLQKNKNYNYLIDFFKEVISYYAVNETNVF
jgi:hypothetical protein